MCYDWTCTPHMYSVHVHVHVHYTCEVCMYMYCRSHMCLIEFYYKIMAGSASGQDGPLLPTQNSRFVHAKAKLFSVILSP